MKSDTYDTFQLSISIIRDRVYSYIFFNSVVSVTGRNCVSVN